MTLSPAGPSDEAPRRSGPTRRVLLGVSAGIAACKCVDLVRRLRERGAEVRVAMTRGAQEFITPLTLQAVSGHRVHTGLLDPEAEAGMGHIELARWADDVLVAPATADLMARAAQGLADDLVTTVLLATEARIWMAPSMNRVMWAHPAVQRNAARLEAHGVRLLGPGIGEQACGEQGAGRMLEPDELAAAVMDSNDRCERRTRDPLAGRRFVVTAGPTHETIDPVRFLGNRSSGTMGFAVAGQLASAGAEVVLVAGPVHHDTPPGVRRVDVTTAEDMHRAVFDALPAEGFVGIAAVADYRPASPSEQKIKKDGQPMTLALVPNPDILAEVANSTPRPFTVGFAAETDAVLDHARSKRRAKGADLIAANRVGRDLGFGRGVSTLHVIGEDKEWPLPSGPKSELARGLVDIIIESMDTST